MLLSEFINSLKLIDSKVGNDPRVVIYDSSSKRLVTAVVRYDSTSGAVVVEYKRTGKVKGPVTGRALVKG